MLNTQHLKSNICEAPLVCYGCDSVNGKAKLHISQCTFDFKRQARTSASIHTALFLKMYCLIHQ